MLGVIVLVAVLNSQLISGLESGASNAAAGNASTSPVTEQRFRSVACGAPASNLTHIAVKNPHHPGATYIRSICEAIIERVDPSITELNIRFKQLELYRPAFDGQCKHDKFAIFTDLDAIVGPVLCGNQTGKTISIPFAKPHSNLIVSIITSDLDHDRTWHIEIEQRR